MANPDLRVKKEVEIDPVNQNWDQQKYLFPTKCARCWLATPGKVSEQCHPEYDLLCNRHLEEGGVKVIPWESAKCPIMMIYSKFPCHINVSPSLSHPCFELN